MLPNFNFMYGPTNQTQTKIKVKGQKGAELFQVPFGSFVTLYDEDDESIFYQKEVDTYGNTKINRFRFIEEPLNPQPVANSENFVTAETFNKSLDEIKEEIRHVEQLIRESSANESNSTNGFNNENGKGQHKSNGYNGKRS